MNVYWVWSLECEQCGRFADAGVVDLVADTLHGIPDVWWRQRQVDLVGSTSPSDRTPEPILSKKNDGNIKANAFFLNPIGDLEEKVNGNLKTPTLILEHGDVVKEIDPIEEVGSELFEDIETEAWSATRSLIGTIFNFYLRHVVDAQRRDKMILRQEQIEGSAKRLRPDYQYGEYQLEKWYNAFARAREIKH